jgi:site-specific recombinase XerD
MKVQEIIVNDNVKYIIIDSKMQPVQPVLRYLRYLDNIGKAQNTLKTYCYHLCSYFEFLEQTNKDFLDVDLESLGKFVGWLRNPYKSDKVINIRETRPIRSESTINSILNCTICFYEYLFQFEEFNKHISETVIKQISGKFRLFKPFLHHISRGNSINKNILKIKEPKKKIRTLTNEQVQLIHDACINIRDELLIRVLYEGGLRINEALTLWIEDFDICNNSIKVRESKTTAGQGRLVYISNEAMNLFQDYLIEYHTEKFDTNFVFVNIAGKNKGQPLKDWAVRSLVKRIRSKTGIEFTPHMFRHSFAVEMFEHGMSIAVIQKLLGHANIQTTAQTYIHMSDKVIRESWEKATNNKTK